MVTDGYQELERDHRAIEAEFQNLLRDEEAPVVRELADHLTRHSQAEGAALYPMLRRYVDDGDDMADRAQQEHATIATMVAQLSDSETPDELPKLVRELQQLVAAHVEYEESELFPAMRSAGVDLDAAKLDLGSQSPPPAE
jgi:hemerythrin superfamily protein